MQSKLNRRNFGAALITVLAVTSVLSGHPAWAGGPDGGSSSGGGTFNPAPGSTNISATAATGQTQIITTTNFHGSGASPMESSDVSWTPPPCWYEPRYTPKQYQDYYRNSLKGWDTGKQFIWPEYQQLEKEKYNQGKDGLWWELVYNENMPPENALSQCNVSDPFVWVPTGDPTPPAGVLTPEELSKIAYAATKLPAPPVQLSPGPDKQVVNLPTYVKFTAPLDRVWVTASLNAQGVNIAATTVATPVAIKIDAGTSDADPQTCTYDLAKSSSGYQVDSSNAPCNITYRRSSGSGTYPLKAQITWKVTWTPSTNPDGPPQQPALPDGLSTYSQDVIVKEIQTVVR
jgi:hypothetical protein